MTIALIRDCCSYHYSYLFDVSLLGPKEGVAVNRGYDDAAIDREDMYKKQEACVRRYHEDCGRIEQQQDDIKRQRLLFQRIGEQICFDNKRIVDQLDEYVPPFSSMYAPTLIERQNQIRFNQAQISEHFSQQLENLAREEQKLADKRQQRERAFKEEIRMLEAGT